MNDKTNLENNEINIDAVSVGSDSDVCGINECVETESPAESLAQVADSTLENAKMERPGNPYFDMNKEQLLDSLKGIVEGERFAAHREVAAIKQRFFALRQIELEDEMKAYMEAGNPMSGFAAMPDPMELDFRGILDEFKHKRADFLAAEEERKAANLELKKKIIDQLRTYSEDIDNINLHFPKFKQLQQDFKDINDIPESAVTDIWKEFQTVVEQFYDRFKMNMELRDLDFKKNLEAKQELIRRAKELAGMEDVVAAERDLQDLHLKWREIGPVAKEYRETIWEEFKEVSTIVRRRQQEYFMARKEEEKANEEAKIALCEKIEAIDFSEFSSYSQWDAASKSIIETQAQWKEIGHINRRQNNELYARFRKACDDFFNAKNEFFKKSREVLQANLAAKQALCEKAESIAADPQDLKQATDKLRDLQAQWKKIGAVSQKYSDEIWTRFRAACNPVFEEYKKQGASERQAERDNLKAKREILDKLKAFDLEQDKHEAARLLKAIQAEWNEIGFVPFRDKNKIQAEYRELCNDLYAKLDMKYTNDRLSRFQQKISSGGSNQNSERDKLQRAYDARKNDLVNYENNLGFFNVKSKEGNSMLKDLERKMDRLRSEMEEIRQKIAILDSQKEN